MKIESIRIKNVRGIQDKEIALGMIPNKPSIIVAPNGSGKSSFAYAFQWLNRLRLKLNEDDAFNGDIENKPELIITTDEWENNVYVASDSQNKISSKFGVFVINNGLQARTPAVNGGRLTDKAKIVVPDIELLNEQPNNVDIEDNFEEAYGIVGAPQGLYPSINSLLSSNQFMAFVDMTNLKIGANPMRRIVEFINRTKGYEGTIAERHQSIFKNDYAGIMKYEPIKYAYDLIKVQCPIDTEVRLLIKAVKLVTLRFREGEKLKTRIEYSRFKRDETNVKALFETIKETWKGIKPHREGGKLILKLGDVQRISNGERDILILLGLLQKAKQAFTKVDNILIIDEVFDYLDDANLIAAQHYVNKFIAELKHEGKNIYPIILSHINPCYFRTFAFRDMKVYYLSPLQYPHASDNMMKLLRKRQDLESLKDPSSDLISKYLLHFHCDYAQDLRAVVQMPDPDWGNVLVFKSYCKEQMNKYLGGEDYDALAVCVQLRELIESYCYSRIIEDEQKRIFLEEKHGTEKKIDYAEEIGIVCPETFSLLGLIYNDPLHPNNKNLIDLRQTLYSRLQNTTIMGMIEEISML